jgi:UDP-2,4-diacetamido-2,4,6-trideoxy-beta-L-altropyranose hydrolase
MIGIRIIFRCDGSRAMGFGHVSRCLTLAAGFVAQGETDIRFICRDLDSEVIARIRAAGHLCHPMAAGVDESQDLRATLAAHVPGRSLLITDSHDLSGRYYTSVHAAGLHVISIDDYAGVAYASDLVVNHNITADQFAYQVAPHTRLLLGPKYLPLRQPFRHLLNKSREIKRSAKSIVVTLGGMPDPAALLCVANGLREWGNESGARITVVLGVQAAPDLTASIKQALPESAQVLVAPPDFAGLLWEADIAVVNGSVTAYEAAAIGTPLMMTAVDWNQTDAVAGFKEKRMAVTLPSAQDLTPEIVASAIVSLASDRDRRIELSAAGRGLVDGKGTERILDAANALFSGEPVGSERGTFHGR